MKTLDILSIPLHGVQLIEAGAGTGKTYTIASMYVRLILESGLSPESILVVTFTQAATEELKGRIRERLRDARRAAAAGNPEDPFLSNVFERIGNRHVALKRLDHALADFDQAAICTIHGFCHRVLRDHAFETGMPFEMELISDPSPLQMEVAEDFWREQTYAVPPELAAYLLTRTKGPAFFASRIKNYSLTAVTVIPNPPKPELRHLDAFRNAFTTVRHKWRQGHTDIIRRLMDPSLKGNIYGALRPAIPGTGLTPRQTKVNALTAAMERLIDSDHPVWPISPELEKFTADKIRISVRKNTIGPTHAFFDLFQDFWGTAQGLGKEMDAYWRYLKTAFFTYADRHITTRKIKRNIIFYEDLLARLETVLEEEAKAGGSWLAGKVGRQYRAALVDEFQDTDVIQYAIFSKLFKTPDNLLCMIGDPKQAIYGFRGADIFSYLSASRWTDEQHTLTANWRSCEGLINAVNVLFSNVKDPFVFPDIAFLPGTSAGTGTADPYPDAPSLVLWLLPHPPRKSLPKEQAVHVLARAIAHETLELLADGVPASDMAVLVRTHRQARRVKSVLNEHHIPAVLFNAGSIFETVDAEEMLRLLTGILEPGRLDRIRGALTTEMLGGTGPDFMTEGTERGHREDRTEAFSEYHRIWSRYGFIPMFRYLADREGIRERLLGLPDGERRLTNILHLAEILHRESLERQTGMTGALKWLREQIRLGSRRSEEHELRLESDANAMRIVTVHGSKGLEFPIVFCPFMWDGTNVLDEEARFHDPSQDNRLTLDLGSQDIQTHRRRAMAESLAENLRLLYVGLTRAKFRCYTAWGRIRQFETASLAYLIHGDGLARHSELTDALAEHMRGISEKQFDRDVERLVHRGKGDIAVERIVPGDAERRKTDPHVSPSLIHRRFHGVIDGSLRITSYSDIQRHGRDGKPRGWVSHVPDYDARTKVIPTGASHPVASSREPRYGDIHTFPSGARAGAFFHDVLEHIDFMNEDREARADTVSQKLALHGFDPEWREAVLQCIENTLKTPLEEGVMLSDVALDSRVSEMEFHFPLNPISPEALTALFAKNAGGHGPSGVPEAMGRLNFSPVRGVMKGFIDLVFRKGDRYYLLDWKSNRLGAGPDSYTAAALDHIMAAENYFLQYHLYVMALHLYLRERIPEYRYETHFGAVYYVFLRGLDHRREPGWGVYRARPEEDLIHRMVAAMVPQ